MFTGACGLAQTAWHLMLFRALLGIGMGGEWASGAALVSETWPDEHRGKALGVVQSSWAVGYAAAAIVTQLVLPGVGLARGVLRRHPAGAGHGLGAAAASRNPRCGRSRRPPAPAGHTARSRLAEIFTGPMLRLTVFVTLMNACTLYAYWAFTQWVPAYLELSPARGGLGLGSYKTLLLVAMNVGMWFGYITFGLVSDRLGRKRTYVAYVLAAAFFVMAYASFRTPLALLLLGPFVGFFGAGYFSGFGAVTAEIYPTRIRATAQGFTYNLGRVASAAAPWTVGTLADSHGFPTAFATAAVAFLRFRFGAVTAEIYPTHIRATARDSPTTSDGWRAPPRPGPWAPSPTPTASPPPSRRPRSRSCWRPWPGSGSPRPGAAPSSPERN